MNTEYYDYYTPYQEVHDKSKNAEGIASVKAVSEELIMKIVDMQEIIDSTIVDEEDCRALNVFSRNIKAIYDDAVTVHDFAESYGVVEEAYVELKEECDKLLEFDGELKTLCDSKPDSSDAKYWDDLWIIFNWKHEFLKDKYDEDCRIWTNKVVALKTDCQTLSDSIDEYIAYLEAVDSCNASDGAIETDVPKPNSVISNLVYPGYDGEVPIADVIPGTEFIRDLRTLSGTERDDFIKRHFPSSSSIVDPNFDINNITIMAGTITLDNGAEVETYYVFDSYYDNQISRDDVFTYSRAMTSSYKNMDPAVLQAVIDNGTRFVFYQNESYIYPGHGAYYWPVDNAITFQTKTFINSVGTGIPAEDQLKAYDANFYSINVPIHELGHAYDHAIGTSNGNGNQDWRDAFELGFPNLYPGKQFDPSGYGEYYAETIKWYYSPNFDPKEFEVKAPDLYQWCVNNLPPRVES